MASFFIVVLVFLLPVFFRVLRQSASVLLAYLFTVSLHQFVAVVNAFFFTTIGAESDAETFHLIGKSIALSGEFEFHIGSRFYENFLGVCYWLFGSSHFFGEQLSVLAFALSCVALLDISKTLQLTRKHALVLLAFGALPSMVLFGSITIRESMQVLFFMVAVQSGIHGHLRGGVNRHFIILALSAILMGLLHNGLLVYMFFLIFVFMWFSANPRIKVLGLTKLRLLLGLSAPAILAGMFLLMKMNISGLGALSALGGGLDAAEYASNYRSNSVFSRATYGIELDSSSLFSFVASSLTLYFYYLFAPFPWRISSALDVYAALEGGLRMVLIYGAVRNWHCSFGVKRRFIGLLLILFFSMSFLWALGTTNYGTAIRHHMLTWWILVVLGVPYYTRRLNFSTKGGDS